MLSMPGRPFENGGMVWSGGCSGRTHRSAPTDGIFRNGHRVCYCLGPNERSSKLGLNRRMVIHWSGRADLNRRPLAPHASALTRLRYAPTVSRTLSTKTPNMSREPHRTSPAPVMRVKPVPNGFHRLLPPHEPAAALRPSFFDAGGFFPSRYFGR